MDDEEFNWLESDGETEDVPGKGIKVPKTHSKRNRPRELILAERKLDPLKRAYARFIVDAESIDQADKWLCEYAGRNYNRVTLYRWRRDDDFATAVRLMQDRVHVQTGLNKARLLNDAEKIKQNALTPRPVLFKGEATGFEEQELGVAMRALEFQGKAVGINDNEGARVLVNVDIDFSGRADMPQATVIEGETSG